MKLRIAVPERVRQLRPATSGGAGAAGAGGGLAAAGPQLATVVLAGAIAAQLAVLAWKFLAPAPAVAPPRAGAAPRSTFDARQLTAAHLFGVAPQAAPGNGEAAPRTNVPLVLVGTLAGPLPEHGLAIVGETPQAARVYAVGATLPGGVRLHSVYPDRVVLDRGGALETLPLPRKLAGGPGFVPPPAASPSGDGGLGANVQKLIAQGPEVVGEMVRPMPDFANGQLRGFRLYPGRDRQKFTKLGLQPGDLVTQVNGVPLSDAQRGMEILRGLGNAGQATVTVERAGAVQQLTVNAAQVATLVEPGDDAGTRGAAPPGFAAPGGAAPPPGGGVPQPPSE
jgi:general secretion pathway protein C